MATIISFHWHVDITIVANLRRGKRREGGGYKSILFALITAAHYLQFVPDAISAPRPAQMRQKRGRRSLLTESMKLSTLELPWRYKIPHPENSGGLKKIFSFLTSFRNF